MSLCVCDQMEDVLKRMEHQFVGLSCVELSQIYQLMLRVQALHSLTAIDQSTDVGQLCSAFLAILNRVSEYVVLDTYQNLTHFRTHLTV